MGNPRHGLDLGESPFARERSRAIRERYTAHPYLWAGIPIAAGLAVVAAAAAARSGFSVMLGLALVAFGIMFEALNLADSVWRRLRRR